MKRFIPAVCAGAAALVVVGVAVAQTLVPVSTEPALTAEPETPVENLPTIAPLPTGRPQPPFLGTLGSTLGFRMNPCSQRWATWCVARHDGSPRLAHTDPFTKLKLRRQTTEQAVDTKAPQ